MAHDSNMIEFPGKENSQKQSAKEKRKKYRRAKARTAGIILFLIAAVVIGYFIYVKTKVFETCITTSSVKRESLAGTKLMEFDGTVLSYSKDGSNAIDGTGKLLWNQTFNLQSPLVASCRDTVAFADYGGSRIYVQTSAGDSFVVTTDKPILKIATSNNGYVAAVLEDTDVTWIYMYDKNGNTISYFRTTMEKSGYPIDIDLSPSGELMCVSYYYMDCNDVKSSVAFFNFGPVGQNSVDNYVSGYNYADSMVPYVRFLDDETAFSISSSRVSVFAGAHKPMNVSEMFANDSILSVYSTSDAIGVIFNNASGGTKYRLELYDKTGKMLSQKAFDFDYSNVTFHNGNVVLYGETSIYVGTYSGDSKFEGTYSKPVSLIVPTGPGYRYIFVTDDSIDNVELE